VQKLADADEERTSEHSVRKEASGNVSIEFCATKDLAGVQLGNEGDRSLRESNDRVDAPGQS